MKTTVIYGRVSTTKQEFDRQVYELKDFAKKNDMKIVEIFVEKLSGLKKGSDRDEFNRMKLYVENNKVDMILATEISRFGRSQLDTQNNVYYFVEKKVNIYFKDSKLFTLNSDGKLDGTTELHLSILANRAQEEIRTLKQRIVSGLRYSASNNGALSGKYQAYGFKSINKKLFVDEEEKKVIIEIFNLYKDGLGCTQIAQHLNNKGVLTRYNKIAPNDDIKTKNGLVKKGKDFSWSSGTIATILKNQLYKGERNHRGEIFKIDPIIDSLLFDTVQSIMTNKNNRPIRTIKNDNYLKGIIKCAVCGESYYMHKRKNNNDSAYKCLSNKLKHEKKMKYCGSPSIGIDKLLNSIIINSHFVLTKVRNSNMLKDERESIKQSKQIEYDNLKAEIKKIEKRYNTIKEMREEGQYSKTEYYERKVKVDQQLENAQDKLETVTKELALMNRRNEVLPNNLDLLPVLREAISVIKIAPARVNNKFKKIYTVKNDVLVDVGITYNYYNNLTVNYTLSRFSDILTHDDYTFENINENILLKN